jgi:hypothetical protein
MEFLQHPGHKNFSDSLQEFITNESSYELFLDQHNLNILIEIVGIISRENGAFLITTDPFDTYQMSLVDFRTVAEIVCSCISKPVDVRIFAHSWGVGISSYSGNDTYEGVDPLPLHALEIKLLLAGSASTWIPRDG